MTSRNNSFSIVLYGADGTGTTNRARENLTRLLKSNNFCDSMITFVDVLSNPSETLKQGIFVTPTLVIDDQRQRHVIIGSLDDTAELNAILAKLSSVNR